jgi:hypothetical protein
MRRAPEGCRWQRVHRLRTGVGPSILGHRHPKVVAAVVQAAEGLHIYGEEHELEILVAEKIQSLVPCAERVAFCSSGSEACQLMMRLARAATNRPFILKFEGHYHGWMDTALWSHHPKREQLGPQYLSDQRRLAGLRTGGNRGGSSWRNRALHARMRSRCQSTPPAHHRTGSSVWQGSLRCSRRRSQLENAIDRRADSIGVRDALREIRMEKGAIVMESAKGDDGHCSIDRGHPPTLAHRQT